MSDLRTAAQQALEALEFANVNHWWGSLTIEKAITALRAALAQQAEPVASLNAWAEQRLARHGIQACLYPQCVGGQSGTVCHKHCHTPCTDCRGIGYDASGQLCGCQQNPSF